MVHSLTASLPQHLYGVVRREYITNNMEMGFEKCIIHAVTCKVSQALTFTILLESGAQYRGVPIHGLSVGQDPDYIAPKEYPLNHQQVWGCFGTDFSIVDMKFNKDMPAECVTATGEKITANGLGWAIEFHGDGYSNAPHQDKNFNMLVSEHGHLIAMPNNRRRWFESSFTDWSLPIDLDVNHKLFYPEKIQEYPEHTAYVKE